MTIRYGAIVIGTIMMFALTGCSKEDNSVPVVESVAAKKVRIATESNYRPFSYINAQGEHEGFEIDLIHALCQQIKADCSISSHDWDTLISGLNANEYDAIFASMSVTDERKKTLDFSEPYFTNQLVLIGKKGDAFNGTMDGKRIAVQQETVAANYLQTHHPVTQIKIYDKQANAYLDLHGGRIDYLLSDVAPAMDWLKSPEGANFEVKGSAIDLGDDIAIAFRKGDTALVSQFNTALASIKQNGLYDKLLAKYIDMQALTIKDNETIAVASKSSDAPEPNPPEETAQAEQSTNN